MRIYDHWAKTGSRAVTPDGHKLWLVAWGGSNQDVVDAEAVASKSVEAMQQRLTEKGFLSGFYDYDHDRSLKEVVIERFGDSENPHAAITRNRYGALVLNSARVFFADVDRNEMYVPPELESRRHLIKAGENPDSTKKRGFLSRLFGRKTSTLKADSDDGMELLQRAAQQRAEQETLIFERFKTFNAKYPELSFRVYETAAGYRVVVTSQTVEPDSKESTEWLDALGSDKLYCKLCEKQECYRARLTPKPWRLPECKSKVFYPNGQYAERYGLENWLEKYEEQSKNFSVCKLKESYGGGVVVDEVAEMLKIHDKYVFSQGMEELA